MKGWSVGAVTLAVILAGPALGQEGPRGTTGDDRSEPQEAEEESNAPDEHEDRVPPVLPSLPLAPSLDAPLPIPFRVSPQLEEQRAEDRQREEEADQRERADLAAQQEMAYWARWLFWVSAAGAAFSGLSLVALFFSLRHTRRAIADNREVGEAQVRAYLAVKSIAFRYHEDRWETRMEIVNAGQSPALNCHYRIAVATDLLERRGEGYIGRGEFSRWNADLPMRFGTVIPGSDFTVGPHPLDFPDIPVREKVFNLRIEVRLIYRTVFRPAATEPAFVGSLILSPFNFALLMGGASDWQDMHVASQDPALLVQDDYHHQRE